MTNLWPQVSTLNLASGGRRLQDRSICQAVPMDEYMAEDLRRWRRTSPYPMAEDWVFASPTVGGKQPYWPDNLLSP